MKESHKTLKYLRDIRSTRTFCIAIITFISDYLRGFLLANRAGQEWRLMTCAREFLFPLLLLCKKDDNDTTPCNFLGGCILSSFSKLLSGPLALPWRRTQSRYALVLLVCGTVQYTKADVYRDNYAGACQEIRKCHTVWKKVWRFRKPEGLWNQGSSPCWSESFVIVCTHALFPFEFWLLFHVTQGCKVFPRCCKRRTWQPTRNRDKQLFPRPNFFLTTYCTWSIVSDCT